MSLAGDVKKISLGLKLFGVSLEKDADDFASLCNFLDYQYGETIRTLHETLGSVKDINGLKSFLKKVKGITGVAIQVGDLPLAEAIEVAKQELADRLAEKVEIIKGKGKDK